LTTQDTASPFVTNRETQATPDWVREDRITKITGILADFHSREPSRNLARARAKFVLRDISHVERASDAEARAESFQNGFTVSYDYGEWDEVNKMAKAPLKNDTWFEVVVPSWKDAGIDLGNGEQMYALIGEEITFEERIVERIGYKGTPYQARKSDPETGWALPPIVTDDKGEALLDDEGNHVFMEKGEFLDPKTGKTRWYPSDAVYLEETAWFEGLFPVEGGGGTTANLSGDPRERAVQLLNEIGSYDDFKVAAAKDSLISTDNALRNEILTGAFSA